MRNEIIIAVVFMFLFIGSASATLTIEPNDGFSDEPIIVTVGENAYETINLSVVYEGMSEGSRYSVVVRRGEYDENGEIVWSAPNDNGTQGDLPEVPNYTQEVNWTPEDTDAYTINATGASASGSRRIAAAALINPVPEMSTIALTSAGILGLVLISRRYRK